MDGCFRRAGGGGPLERGLFAGHTISTVSNPISAGVSGQENVLVLFAVGELQEPVERNIAPSAQTMGAMDDVRKDKGRERLEGGPFAAGAIPPLYQTLSVPA
jgi:hypothetical protein